MMLSDSWREGGTIKMANLVTLLRGALIAPIVILLLTDQRNCKRCPPTSCIGWECPGSQHGCR